MKVALIQCPVWGTREPPLGMVQLSGCLKARGIISRAFDFNNFIYSNREDKFRNLWAWEQSMFWYSEKKVKEFFSSYSEAVDSYVEEILRFAPDVAGFSVSASTYLSSCEFAKRLKIKNSAMKIVFGGQFFFDRANAKKSFDSAPVDYIIAGEADESFPELAQLLENEGQGLCRGVYTKRNGSIEYGGDRPLLDMDKLPYSDYSDLRINDYDDVEHISIMASRGCVWNCAFCSSRAFWDKYRYMSGERIHQEIVYHRLERKMLGHVDFMDLVFNGSMKRVEEFCRLMIKYPPEPREHRIRWTANAIIHPGLTRDFLQMMAESGCKKLIFGIESGSERVLGLMKKPYRISDAKRIIRDATSAGIQVTANFMFGFPGETEEDFLLTLDFIRETGEYLERVYPSRTYCAIEEFSYMNAHPVEFGIKVPFNHHLYWETEDGSNNFPVRLERCAKFEELCGDLGVLVDCGVRTSVEMDSWYNLGHYYEFMGDSCKSEEYFRKYLEKDPDNLDIRGKIYPLKLGGIPEAKKEHNGLTSGQREFSAPAAPPVSQIGRHNTIQNLMDVLYKLRAEEKYSKAEALSEAVISDYPESEEIVKSFLGEMYLEKKDFKSATQILKEIKGSHASRLLTSAYKGQVSLDKLACLKSDGKLREARELMEKIISDYPGVSLIARAMFSEMLIERGNPDSALRLLSGIDGAEKNGYVLRVLAAAYRSMNDSESAKTFFSRAAEYGSDIDRAISLFEMGRIFSEEGDTASGENLMSEALKAHPGISGMYPEWFERR